MHEKTTSIDIIFFIKGIAIILVVIGHYYPHDSPNYWALLKESLYLFHMPTFFAVSGFLFFKSSIKPQTSSGMLLLNKAKRLGIPYISIALLFFGIKYVSQFFLNLDHPVSLASFFSVFTSPVESYMPLLWFMYSLFTMMVIVKLFENLISPFWIFIASIILHIAIPNAGSLLSIGATISNFPFFLAGYISYNYLMNEPDTGRHNAPWWVSLFIFVSVFAAYKQFDHLNTNIVAALKLILGFLGIYFVIMLSASLLSLKRALLLKTVGLYSMSIYLFHTLFESSVRHVVQLPKISSSIPFLLGALPAILAGVLFPLLLEKYVLRRYAATRRLFLGLG